MNKNIIQVLGLSAITLLSAVANAAPRAHTETIIVEDKMGTIKEERVQSVQSSVTVTSNSGSSYTLIDMADEGTSEHDEHLDSGQLSIPSWTVFSW